MHDAVVVYDEVFKEDWARSKKSVECKVVRVMGLCMVKDGSGTLG